MAVLMKIEGWCLARPCPLQGLYVATANVQAAGDDIDWLAGTPDPAKALRFPSIKEALEKWNEVLERQPVRLHDGKPNKPLTAFHMAFEKVEE